MIYAIKKRAGIVSDWSGRRTTRSMLALLVALCAFSMTGLRAGGQSSASEEKLVGLWGAQVNDSPMVEGALAIDGRGTQWRALIGGFNVPVERKGVLLTFELPGGRGTFRGRLRPGRTTIVGQWTQPATSVLSNQYATPVQIRELSPGVWRGRIAALQPQLSFYVSIRRTADGSLSARIRNPEFGWLQRSRYGVELKGNAVTLTDSQPGSAFAGTYDSRADQLLLPLVSGAPPLLLTRRANEDAVGFSAVTPPAAHYNYRPPIPDKDGWSTASLVDVGLNPAPILALVEKILTADPGDDTLNIQSLLIARHGRLVFEQYFHGFRADRPHDMRSAGKTFAPMLLGIARQRGAKIGAESRVYSVFASDGPFANWDERKSRMRVKDLMSMTAGYDCDEDHSASAPGNEAVMQSQTAQPDWYKYALDLPVAHEPGGAHAYYCSAELNLVGGVAHLASGKPLTALFYEDFARPLQFGTYHLNLMPTGEAYMGGGAYVQARDQLKLGQLYLNGGVWNGHRILAGHWVKQSLSVHASFEDRLGVDHQYGWGWHIHHLKVGNRVWTEYEAGGNGGQLIVILPELDMVVGFTGAAYGNFAAWGPWGIQLVPRYIIPAAAD